MIEVKMFVGILFRLFAVYVRCAGRASASCPYNIQLQRAIPDSDSMGVRMYFGWAINVLCRATD